MNQYIINNFCNNINVLVILNDLFFFKTSILDILNLYAHNIKKCAYFPFVFTIFNNEKF